ncbi:MAG TPA: hypothetical protein VHX44_00585 [Planctomycetota bacterium]|nr:hypothetical protein [Planctomycetota bacterium]
MDPITRRSASLATAIHACLVALAFAPRGCSEIPDPTPPPPPAQATTQPQAPSEVNQPAYGTVVAVPAAAPTSPAALPPLGPNDLPALPDLGHIVSSVRQDHASSDTSRGEKSGARSASPDLPALSANPDDLIPRLQHSAVSNETLTREQRMLGTAQEFLHGRLQGQIDRKWRHLMPQVTEPRLVIELRVDRRGHLTYTHLVNSSGSLTLDRLIGEWLQGGDFNFPPITPDIVYLFLIVIRR